MKKLNVKLLMALLLISFTSATISAADWGLFDLKGKVKSVTYKTSHEYNNSCPYIWRDAKLNEVNVVSFSKEGKVIPPKGIKIIRNKRGHITDIKYLGELAEGGTIWSSQEVARDSKERLTYLGQELYESSCEYNHYYNEKGYVYKSVITGNVVEDEYKETITYTYDSFDDNGNWTKRTCKLVGKLTSGNGGYYDNGKKETYTETRKITYYGTSASKDKKATKSTDSKKSSKSKDSKKSSTSKDSKKSSSSKSKSSKSSKK